MKKTSTSATTIIELILSSKGVKELEGILTTSVNMLLPHTCPQRVFVSYFWLLIATLHEVIIIGHPLQATADIINSHLPAAAVAH